MSDDQVPFKQGDRVESRARGAAGVCTTDEQGRGDRDRMYAGSKQVTVRVLWDDGAEYDVPVPALRREERTATLTLTVEMGEAIQSPAEVAGVVAHFIESRRAQLDAGGFVSGPLRDEDGESVGRYSIEFPIS